MAQQTVQYDARDVSVTWGEIILDGAGDGDFLTITYDVDAVTKTVGAQGFVCATISANDGGRVTWTGSQGTPTHDRLSAYAALQRRTGSGLIKKVLTVKHNNGTTLAIGAEAWIMKMPDTTFGADHQNREWVFDIAHLELMLGGSVR